MRRSIPSFHRDRVNCSDSTARKDGWALRREKGSIPTMGKRRRTRRERGENLARHFEVLNDSPSEVVIGKKGTQMTEGNIFSGFKVVDLSSFIAGPSAATILSDFGADVVKVEPPEGELWRRGQKIPA